MQFFSRVFLCFSFFSFFLAFPAEAITPEADIISASKSSSCFYFGDIVQDASGEGENELTFHDSRAIQLYLMGELGEGMSKDYIEANIRKISDFAREVPTVSELENPPDWYDGRIASLMGVIHCAAVTQGETPSMCPEGVSDFFANGDLIERVRPYLSPCGL
jgi:hypothetical protein